MLVRSKVLSLIYRICSFLLGLSALIVACMHDGAPSLLYFGVLLTLFSLVLLLIEIILNIRNLASTKFAKQSTVYGQILFVCICLELSLIFVHPICFGFSTLSYPNANYFDLGRLPTLLLLYMFFPLSLFFDWFLFSSKGNCHWHWLLYLAFPPIVYFVYSEIDAAIRNTVSTATPIFDPNTFLNQGFMGAGGGWVGVIVSSITVLAVILTIGTLFIILSSYLGGKFKTKKDSSLDL